MKRVMLLSFMLAIGFTAVSQPFVLEIGTHEINSANGAIETPEGDFVILLNQGVYTPDYNIDSTHQKLIRVNTHGQVKDSLLIPDNIASPSSGIGLIYNSPDYIFLAGTARTQAYNPAYGTVKGIRFIVADYELDILHDTIVWWNGSSFLNLGPPVLNHSGNFVFPVGLSDTITHAYVGSACWEISPFGHVVRQKFYDQFLPTSNIIEIPALNCYHIYSYYHIAEIDTGLNYVRNVYDVPQDSLFNNLHHLQYARLLTDTTYILMGQQFQSTVPGVMATNDAAWEIMNVSGDWETFPPYNFGLYQINDYPRPLDFITSENIYCSFQPSMVSDTGRPMYLYSFRQDGSLNWKVAYRDGINYYWTNTVLATSDGGCLWMGVKFYPSPSTRNDAIVIKVGIDGNLNTAIEKPSAFSNTKVYPNPGGDFFILETPIGQCVLELYSSQGVKVLLHKLRSGINRVNTGNLPGGSYLYKVLCGDKTSDEGIWIKN